VWTLNLLIRRQAAISSKDFIIIIIIIINEKINVAFSPKTTRTRNIPKTYPSGYSDAQG